MGQNHILVIFTIINKKFFIVIIFLNPFTNIYFFFKILFIFFDILPYLKKKNIFNKKYQI
jgi:predicted membrane protein